MPNKIWVLAVLALAACGGPPDPAAETDPALDPESAVAADQAGIEPELVATDPAGAPTTGRFELGVHYLRLSPTQPTSSNPEQVEVCEVFWYGCPHCNELDPLLERWRERKPDYVSFIRVPAVWNPRLQLHARAFYTAEALGKGAEMHTEFFSEIHARGNALDTEPKLQEFFGRFGVDAAAFKTAFDSFAVQAKLQRADELSRRYRIDGVPTMVVNGKYTTDATLVGSYDELIVLVEELVAAEREAR
jgi:protein dithiol oxidoreductase (disulfide-forming)